MLLLLQHISEKLGVIHSSNNQMEPSMCSTIVQVTSEQSLKLKNQCHSHPSGASFLQHIGHRNIQAHKSPH
jgi:hypothetical protein